MKVVFKPTCDIVIHTHIDNSFARFLSRTYSLYVGFFLCFLDSVGARMQYCRVWLMFGILLLYLWCVVSA